MASGEKRGACSRRRMSHPPSQLPMPRPARKIERKIEIRAEVTPNLAIPSRSQMTSYRTLHKPERKKKKKNQRQEENEPAEELMIVWEADEIVVSVAAA